MQNLNSLALFVLVCAILSLSRVSSTESQNNEENSLVRSRFTLPKLFEFEYFKSLFKKQYQSLLEQAVRKRLYLGRAFRAFISAVKYKYRKSSIYLAINNRSDWTPEEVRSIQMSREDLLEPEELVEAQTEKKQQPKPNTQTLPVANLEDIERKLEEVAAQQNERPGFREITQELEVAQLDRPKRSSDRQLLRSLSLNDLIHRPAGEREEVSDSVPSNNPNYEPIELRSFGLEEDKVFNEFPESEAEVINNTSGSNFLNEILRSASDLFTLALQKLPSSAAKPQEATAEEETVEVEKSQSESDKLIIDHRVTNCFFEPRDQGKCGSCWVMSGKLFVSGGKARLT